MEGGALTATACDDDQRMITLRTVNPAEWILRAGALLAQNWAETGADFDFEPDVLTYQKLYDIGMAFGIGAFDGDDPCGYCTVMVVRHHFNPSVIFGSNDALFVAPEYRSRSVGARLIVAAEKEAAARGASRFNWHCRPGTSLAEVLEKRGYAPLDIIVSKEIQHGH